MIDEPGHTGLFNIYIYKVTNRKAYVNIISENNVGGAYGAPKKEVLTIVQQIINSKGINAVVTDGLCVEKIYPRHPNLTLKTAIPLTLARAKAGSKEVLSRYLDIFHDCLNENGILNNPAINNCYKTGFPLNPACHKVVDTVGSRHPSYITGGGKQQFTVLACTSATGIALPPFVVHGDI